MDDPLIQQDSPVKKYGIPIAGGAAVLFITIVIILTFVAGAGMGIGWFICGGAMFMFTLSTLLLLRWIQKEELEEAKHTYLAAFQCLGLILFAIGALFVIYKPMDNFIIGGCAADVTGSGLRLNDGITSVSVPSGPCSGFAFDDKFGKDQTFAVTIESQPSTAVCKITKGSGGTIAGNVIGATGVGITCAPAFTLGGTIVLQGVPGEGITLTNNGADSYTVKGAGSFTFGTPLVPMSAYVVNARTPPGVSCSILNNNGTVVDKNVENVQVTCLAGR